MTTNNNAQYLYHGSRFEQTELKPGFYHTGKLVMWDGVESNKYLYATTDESLAVELGFASSIEKEFEIDRFHVEGNQIQIQSPQALTIEQIAKVPVFIYTLELNHHDGWIKNNNKHNGIDTEYKTSQTIRHIPHCRVVDVAAWLKHYEVDIQRNVPKTGDGQSKTAMEGERPSWAAW